MVMRSFAIVTFLPEVELQWQVKPMITCKLIMITFVTLIWGNLKKLTFLYYFTVLIHTCQKMNQVAPMVNEILWTAREVPSLR